MDETKLQTLLNQSAALHEHLCPKQVLGVRMGIYAAELLGIDLPRRDKRVITIVETDGCFADGVAVASGCWLGHRTLRCVDYGKVAATFIDSLTGEAVRIRPSEDARQCAGRYAPTAEDRWYAYLEGYKAMPVSELLVADRVRLAFSVEELVSSPDRRAVCGICKEEIINGREIVSHGRVTCCGCHDGSYFRRCSR